MRQGRGSQPLEIRGYIIHIRTMISIGVGVAAAFQAFPVVVAVSGAYSQADITVRYVTNPSQSPYLSDTPTAILVDIITYLLSMFINSASTYALFIAVPRTFEVEETWPK